MSRISVVVHSVKRPSVAQRNQAAKVAAVESRVNVRLLIVCSARIPFSPESITRVREARRDGTCPKMRSSNSRCDMSDKHSMQKCVIAPETPMLAFRFREGSTQGPVGASRQPTIVTIGEVDRTTLTAIIVGSSQTRSRGTSAVAEAGNSATDEACAHHSC